MVGARYLAHFCEQLRFRLMIKAFIAWMTASALLVLPLQADLSPSASDVPPCREVPAPERMIRPKYPKEALRNGKAGTVRIRVVVTSEGRTKGLVVVEGEPDFSKSALVAIHEWRFHPVSKKGRSVETTYNVHVRFNSLLREANSDVELESPKEEDEGTSAASPTDFKFDTPDGPVYKVSPQNGVVGPKVTYQTDPEFSEQARKAAEQGNVTVSLVVGTDGKPRNIKVECSSVPDLNGKAIEAVNSWRFEPGTRDGKPVMVEIAVEVEFHLYK